MERLGAPCGADDESVNSHRNVPRTALASASSARFAPVDPAPKNRGFRKPKFQKGGSRASLAAVAACRPETR